MPSHCRILCSHWGRGIYFAERSGYANHYAFKPLTKYSSRDKKDREVFLVKLLAGDVKLMDRNQNASMSEVCKSLVTPPFNGATKSLYDTVMGIVDDEYGTKVYVVYENGRAYPEYLVRYYIGSRDPERTPFESLEEAVMHKKAKAENRGAYETVESSTASINDEPKAEPDQTDVVDDTLPSVHLERVQQDEVRNESEDDTNAFILWEFHGDEGWLPYDDLAQEAIEEAYGRDERAKLTMQAFPFEYQLDLGREVQTNLTHPAHKQRKIRRHVIH